MQNGVLLIVCGPSGVGKTSLTKKLLDDNPRLVPSVSYTTRAPRDGEEDGVDYHFVEDATFEAKRDAGAFAEWAEVHGNYYGTPKSAITEAWAEDNDVIFDIDYQGARQLKDAFPGAVGVLVIPPSMDELEARLRGRETDTEAVIQRRLSAAREELARYELFDYIVENDDFDEAFRQLDTVYEAARLAMPLQRTLLADLLT
ncbi:MAG: guanylate kinase [Myxococcota bacterium]